MYIIYLLNALYVIIILILGGLGMIEALWAIAAAVISGGFVILGVWLQGRKDSVRIKDVDDKTNRVEPTYNNTEKLLREVSKTENTYSNTEKLLNKVERVTEYVIKQDALQQAAKNTSFDYNLFVSQMQATLKTIEGLNQRIDELEYQNELLQNQLETVSSKNLENEEELETNAFSRDDEMEM